LTAFPVAEEDWQEMGADKLLVKPMHTRILLQQIEDLIASHERKLAGLGLTSPATKPAKPPVKKKVVAKKVVVKKTPPKKAATAKTAIRKKPVAKKAIAKKAAKTSVKTKPARRRAKS
jgi:DNA-binding response OmpR family regulator